VSRLQLLALTCALCTGCPNLEQTQANGSAAGSGSGTACAPLDGVYRATYTQLSGSCGPQSDELLEYRAGRAVPNGTSSCQVGGEAMVSACELRRSSVCALSDGLSGTLIGHASVDGTLRETDGNERLEGTLEVAIRDTTGRTCESTYQVVVVKTR